MRFSQPEREVVGVLDESVTARLAEDVGAAFLVDLYAVFVVEIELLGKQLQHLDNAAEIARLAHTLKSLAASYGAAVLWREAVALESKAKLREGDLVASIRRVCRWISATADAVRNQYLLQ